MLFVKDIVVPTHTKETISLLRELREHRPCINRDKSIYPLFY